MSQNVSTTAVFPRQGGRNSDAASSESSTDLSMNLIGVLEGMVVRLEAAPAWCLQHQFFGQKPGWWGAALWENHSLLQTFHFKLVKWLLTGIIAGVAV